MLAVPERTNYFIEAPDQLGLGLLLQGALATTTSPEDIQFYDAASLTKERAREIENEARLGPRGGSKLTQIYIYRLSLLPAECVGPLLKAVEEARFGRFIFQAQRSAKKIETLRSRSVTVRLPFFTKKAVLANLKVKNYDARAVDELGLYDGTIQGTIRALSMKDTMMSLRRELKNGPKGRPILMANESLISEALKPAVEETFTPAERRFWNASEDLDEFTKAARKRMILHLMTARS